MRLTGPIALALASSACFATRNDVRILQGDIHALQVQQAQSDSIRARQLADLTAALNTTLAVVRDSIRELSERLTTFQGGTRQELYTQAQQLLRLEELLGQSSAAISRFRADLEVRSNQLLEQQMRATQPPVTPGDTTQPVVVPPPVTEGPNVLYQIGRDQAMRGAHSAARDAFTRLLTEFQSSDLAPDAQLGIAESFGAEKRVAEEDSTYRVVYAKYPASDAAPTALYKLGLSLDRQGKRAEARAMMQRVISEYPGSDSFRLATDWLTNHP